MRNAVIASAAALLFAFSGASAQDLSDAQIASIVVTANQVDVDAGNLARTTTARPEVKQFAERMIVDHASANQSLLELLMKLKITPQDNATSQSLKSGGDSNLASLKTLKDDAFNRTYIDREIAYHQQLLDTVDKTLIPGAKNERLKALLVKMRLTLLAHLEHARLLQPSSMKAGDAAAKKS